MARRLVHLLTRPPPPPKKKNKQEAEDFFAAWGNEGNVDICDALSDLIILTATRCLHGDDVRQVNQ